jgi:hypothetical protein
MEGTITLIFCHGNAWYSKIIQQVEHGYWTHVAGILLDSTLEAQGIKDPGDRYGGFWAHDIDKYKDGINCKFVNVEVYDIEAAKRKARYLLGCPYSFHDCVEEGISELFDLELPVDGELTVMCAEAWDIILRAAVPKYKILPKYKPDFVGPMRLYNALI